MPRTPTPTSTEPGEKAVRFFAKLAHIKGEWAGQRFELEDWQKDDIIRPLFGTLNPDGYRQYRTALIGMPRKSGKSTLAAGIALKLTFADGEPGAEVYSAAADREQAGIVFETAKKMVMSSRQLMSVQPRIYKRVIEVPHTGSTYRVISADAYLHHGLSPHGVIFDELHVQPNRKLWDVLTSGQGARRQPLVLAITTAGNDPASICAELYRYGSQVRDGVIDDPSFFFRWWGADRADDWTDEAVWEKANPNLDVSVSRSFLRSESRQACQTPARQNTFRQLYLNQWVQQATRWLDLRAWDATAGMVVEDQLVGRRCYGGLDLASASDIAALCWDFPSPDGSHDVLWRFFLPEERLGPMDERTAGAASVWARQGWLTVTEGNVLDYRAVIEAIDRDARRFDVAELAFDRWGMQQLRVELADAGMLVIEFGQGFASMSSPTKEWERLILDGRYRHGGNPVMRWMADNIVVRTDPSGNVKIDKAKSHEKVDGAVAAVMALDRAMRPPRRTGRAAFV